MVKFHQTISQKNSSKRRWLNFLDTILVYKNIIFEYIKGKDNNLADQLSRLNLNLKITWLLSFSNINTDLVIGLNFIFQDNGGCILTRDGVVFFRETTYTPVQTTRMLTRGRYNNNSETSKPCCETCRNKEECKKEVYQEEDSDGYNSDEDIIGKDYALVNIETNFYDFHKGINKIGNINGPKDLDHVIKLLDELEIIGENH